MNLWLNYAGKVLLGILLGVLIGWGGFTIGGYLTSMATMIAALALIEQPWVRR